MNCKEFTEVAFVQKTMESSTNKEHLERIFSCIYKLFCNEFIHLILSKYSFDPGSRERISEMAKDAFQEGLLKFYDTIKREGLRAEATLKTIVFTFCQWQFRAIKKKEDRKETHVVSINNTYELEDGQDATLTIYEAISDNQAYWDESLRVMLSEEEHMLYSAIRMLPNDKWQKALICKYFDEMKPAEIASMLKVSKGYIENELTHARKSLKKILISKFNF